MFRIKTALLACLLLVTLCTSAQGNVLSDSANLENFSSFLAASPNSHLQSWKAHLSVALGPVRRALEKKDFSSAQTLFKDLEKVVISFSRYYQQKEGTLKKLLHTLRNGIVEKNHSKGLTAIKEIGQLLAL